MTDQNFYLKNKNKFMHNFNFLASRMKPVIVQKYKKDLADELLAQSRTEFERLLPGLPDVGGRQPFLQFTLATGMFLAVYRVTTRHHISLEETGQVLYDGCRQLLRTIPSFIAGFLGHSYFSKKRQDRTRVAALASHEQIHPESYVFDFVEGDGRQFDYGVDYLDCASVKYLRKQGAPDLAPYLCPIDILYSNAFHWGLKRTMTLADGDPKCDFRFRKGYETDVVVKCKLSTSS